MPGRVHRGLVRVLVFGLTLAAARVSLGAAPPEPPSRTPAIVTGAVALASLTTAVVYTARSLVIRRALIDDRDDLVQYDQDDRRLLVGRRELIAASSLYGATAVLGALTIYYLVRRTGPGARRLAVAPSVSLDGGGLVLTVGF